MLLGQTHAKHHAGGIIWGLVLAAAGVAAYCAVNNNPAAMRKVRRSKNMLLKGLSANYLRCCAADTTRRIADDAGEKISGLGRSLASKIR